MVLTLARSGACCRGCRGTGEDCVVVGLLHAVMCRYVGAGPGWSGCRSSLRPAVWACSGAVATRGVDQAGDHADGSGVMTHGGRARLRPECSRRLGSVERADVAVAQTVVDQREQFACRGDLGDIAAAASFDTVLVGCDLDRGWVALHSLGLRPNNRFGAFFGDGP